jgi:2-polyprenyl-6-methoxyphenol hydroxylase-like FAD-dependent oxidoreductase
MNHFQYYHEHACLSNLPVYQVFERSREYVPAGAVLTIGPNGLKALEAISPTLVENAEASASSLKAVSLYNKAGEFVMLRGQSGQSL